MEALVKQFFAENPEATECFVCLGYVLSNRSEAERKLAGVKGQMVTRYEREVGVSHVTNSEAALEKLIIAEGNEQKAHEAYDLNATDENMKAWKAAQKEVEHAQSAYDKAVSDEAIKPSAAPAEQPNLAPPVTEAAPNAEEENG